MTRINKFINYMFNIVNTEVAKMLIVKISVFVGLIVWGLILWYDLPNSISYISILYGMAVQLWGICTICTILKLFGKRWIIYSEKRTCEVPNKKKYSNMSNM